MKKPLRNVGASVRERLLLLARSTGQPNGDLLDRYCLERFLYRLSCSEYRERFILKGAMLLTAWGGGVAQRLTRDADLLGFGDSSISGVRQVFRDICRVEVPDDGVQFGVDSILVDTIRAQQEYAGVRVELRASLAGAVVRVQVDVGFGDAVDPTELMFPSLLDFPQPSLRAYTRENAIAEKFEAMNKLGMANTRMKDYFDIWHLSHRFDFIGIELARTNAATFMRRGTPLPTGVPLGLSLEFAGDRLKQTQWRAFWKKAVRRELVPELPEIVSDIGEFLMPAVTAAKQDGEFNGVWPPGGPWQMQ
jgi:predicted nucleotidyltransferase component of viral defense system